MFKYLKNPLKKKVTNVRDKYLYYHLILTLKTEQIFNFFSKSKVKNQI